MSEATSMSRYLTREDHYFDALDAFLKTSAVYLDVDASPHREEEAGDPEATWLTDLRPAFGEREFFFEEELRRIAEPYSEPASERRANMVTV